MTISEQTKRAGLHMATYAPGDGVTRYRFFLAPSDYSAGDAIYTALGRKQAETFIAGFACGQAWQDIPKLGKARSEIAVSAWMRRNGFARVFNAAAVR